MKDSDTIREAGVQENRNDEMLGIKERGKIEEISFHIYLPVDRKCAL